MSSFKERLIGAAKLDIKIFEEVEADKGAMNQAMVVVILSSLAAGLGGIGKAGIGGLLIGTIIALILAPRCYPNRRPRQIWVNCYVP